MPEVQAVRQELKDRTRQRLGDLLAGRGIGYVPGPFQLLSRYSPHTREALNRIGDAIGVGAEFSDVADVRDAFEGSRGVSEAVQSGDVVGGLASGAQMVGGAVGTAAGPLVSAKMFYPLIGAITAFHGTPHRFDKFDMGKVGTGEGNQAFGHGLYFAETQDVAADYAYRLSRPNFSFTKSGDAVSSDLSRMLEDAYDDVRRRGLIATGQDAVTLVGEALAKQRADALKANDFEWFNRVADQQAELHRIVSRGEVPKPAGHLYKVDLKPEEDELLDWDKPLSEQSEKVREALRNIGNAEKRQRFREIEAEMGRLAADRMPNNQMRDEKRWFALASERDALGRMPLELQESSVPIGVTLNRAYRYKLHGGDLIGSDEATPDEISKALRAAGIRGIKYLEGASRAKGAGNHNYVIFDDADIEILARNGEEIARAARKVTETPEFRKWFGDSKVVDDAGEPLVLYHGTKGDIGPSFDPALRGSHTKSGGSEHAFFFTSKPRVAETYAKRAPRKDFTAEMDRLLVEKDRLQTQYDAMLTSDNPSWNDEFVNKLEELRWQMEDHEMAVRRLSNYRARGADAMKAAGTLLGDVREIGKDTASRLSQGGGESVYPVYIRAKNPLIVDAGGKVWNELPEPMSKTIARAKAAGHDGVIFKNLYDAMESYMGEEGVSDIIAVFEPTQIKSPFNKGKFDPDNPDILGALEMPGRNMA